MARSAVAILVGLLVAGCVDNFHGSRFEVNLNPGSDGGDSLVLPTPGLNPGDPGYFSHYELHGVIDGAGTVRLRSFLVQKAIQVHHPCLQFQPDPYCHDSVDFQCAPYMNMERFREFERIWLAVDFNATEDRGSGFDHFPGYDLDNRQKFPASLFVDPSLTDPAALYDRSNLSESAVRDFCANLPSRHYLGNVNVLLLPLSGEMFGAIDAPDPRTGVTVGGFTLIVPAKLGRLTELLLTKERDPSRVSEENRNKNLPPGTDGEVFLVGQKDGAFGFIRYDENRGVLRVFMESPVGRPVTWNSTVYYNLDEDPVLF